MRLAQPPAIRKPLPLTPLVDIVFLLLMFFMLTSNFTKFGSLKLDITKSSATASPAPANASGVIIRVDKDLDIRINGQHVALAKLASILNSFKDKGIEKAALRATPQATVQDLVTVLETARTSTLTSIVIAP